ncbi:MAG: hypothetical protein ACYTJ0_04205 [Planctomycetota bacterium]|jgi:hypothetical protein
MAQIEVVSERESGTGWIFEIQVLDDDGALRRHRLGLSWADYDLWCPGGEHAPALVAEAVIGFLLARGGPAGLRREFDASLARQLHADADAAIPALIGR